MRLTGIAFVLIHGIFFVSAFWSKNMQAFIQYKKTNDIGRATHAIATLERKQRKPIIDICEILSVMIDGKAR